MQQRSLVALRSSLERAGGSVDPLALALAEAGYDVAITARTVKEGEGRADPVSVGDVGEPLAVPGSLERTASEISALGRRAIPIQMDLLNRESVIGASDEVLALGGADVLVNNAAYEGPGLLDLFLDLTPEVAERILVASFVNPMLMTQMLLPRMIEKGGGVVVNLTSPVAHVDPSGPADQAGWGLGHASVKGALDRMAGVIHGEFAPRGIRAYNLDPGLVMTEVMRARGMVEFFGDRIPWVEPDVPGAVIAWLAYSPDAVELAGQRIIAQELCTELGLVAAS